MTSRLRTSGRLLAGLAALALGAMSGCRGDRSKEPPRQFFPSLDDQPKYKAQSEVEFFPDSRSARDPMAGVVAFGRPYQTSEALRDDFLREDDRLYRGVDAGGAWLERIPVDAVLRDGESFRDLVDLGRKTFEIYCLPCHGGLAVGGLEAPYAGMVGARWSYPIPNLHDPQYHPGGEKGQDGYLFSTIRNGVANAEGQMPRLRMPAYAEVVSPHEAWAVVAYLRVLQATRSGSYDSLNDAARQRLDEQRTQSATPTAATGSMNSEDAS
jgi:mono/diheme cytochrome c family protein